MRKAPNKIRVNGQVYVKADRFDPDNSLNKRILDELRRSKTQTKWVDETLDRIEKNIDKPENLRNRVEVLQRTFEGLKDSLDQLYDVVSYKYPD